MRVQLVTSLPGGGPLEHSLVLSRALAEAGGRVEAICCDEGVAARFAAGGASPVVLPLRHLADLPGGVRLERLASRADVVHAQDRRSGLWTRAFPRRGVPRVYTVHGLPDPFLPPPAGGSASPGLRDRIAYRGVDALLAHRADAVVVPSHFLRDQLVQRLGFPAARLRVIPNGVDPGPRLPAGELVGTISLLEPVKALDVFLAAAAKVAARRPSARFAIYGEGRERRRLEALAEQLGVAAAVEFRGHLPAREALSELGLYVLCSWLENCPMSLLEAMEAGIPAVATEVGGVPEMTGDTVPLVPPGDPEALATAILARFENPEVAEAAAARARQRVEDRFSAAGNATALLDLYEQLARGR